MRVVFLDFDGVLNSAYYNHVLESKGLLCSDEFGAIFDPSCTRNLGRIIEETDAKIVITSSWKSLMSYRDFLNMWRERNLPGQVIDVCPNRAGCRNRGDEIDSWLSECKEKCQYVIIDDMWADNFNEHQISHLLVVNPYFGIEESDVERAIIMLNSQTV